MLITMMYSSSYLSIFVPCGWGFRAAVIIEQCIIVAWEIDAEAEFLFSTPLISVAPRFQYLTSRCPIMELQARHHPLHYTVH